MPNAKSVANDPVDAIYLNAKVITVDADFSIAEAFAVRGDKFAAVGTNSEIKKLAKDTTPTFDLRGKTVVPGFVDSHSHVAMFGANTFAELSLDGLTSVAAIADRIGKAAAKAAPGEWIVTSSIGVPPDHFHLPESLAERRWPTRVDLDKVAPNNPVYIPTPLAWPHPCVLNTKALNLLGVTRDTPDEAMVIIEKDASGEPNGLIYGFHAYNRLSQLYPKLKKLLPRIPQDLEQKGVLHALAAGIPAGLTTLYEGHLAFWLPVFNKLKSDGALPVRLVSTYDVPVDKPLPEIDAWMKERPDAMGRGTGDHWLKVVGITMPMDGAPQFGAAMMDKPYRDPYGRMSNGTCAVTLEKLIEISRLAVKNNMRVNFVVGGRGASQILVEGLEIVNRETPLKPLQWVAAHLQNITRDQIERLAKIGLMITTYTAADYSKGADTWVKCFDDPEIAESAIPVRWWLDAGVEIAQSTDGAHFQPLFTLWESLQRVDGRTGKSLLSPAKKITREEAIKMYTIYAAKILQWEDLIGSIEAGKLADFAVLDRDILTVPVDEIRTTAVLKTSLGGKIVHDAEKK